MPAEWRQGALVRARERLWVVLPDDEDDVIRLRPIDGSDADAIGIHRTLEPEALSEATYPPPSPERALGSSPGRLLHDAARLRLRSGAGPFRSMGQLSVEPRPYQLVPLLMALRLDPVRLLIADDVGVGKTIEAGLIARELLDRGMVKRIGVLCPPHLCEQWERELSDKFNIEAALVQPSRMAHLERGLPEVTANVFEYYRHIVASIDFMKSGRYRDTFLQYAPDLIIVDEAHAAARPREARGGAQQQRHELLRRLAEDDPERSIILVTATPHSGIEKSFRSLLGLLNPDLDRPEEKPLPLAEVTRRFVQRKRSDLRNWLGKETPFPERVSSERPYTMTAEYVRLYEDVRAYCQELVSRGPELQKQQRRVRYWAATAILRCLLSSPAAAVAMLHARRERQDEHSGDAGDEAIEALGVQVLDSADEEEPADYAPAAALDKEAAGLRAEEIQRLDAFLRRARRLAGPEHDAKLAAVAEAVGDLLNEGFRPIVYCRFIATAEYVAGELQRQLKDVHPGLRVSSVTGGDGNSEQRRERVEELADEALPVLVATDCLSEGINLQQHFDAVVHYDLPWNPNRLEQREGRVDRYGQRRDVVKTTLLYGSNNAIDLTVLEVLIRKARTIREQLGVSVPVPDSDELVQAVIDSVLERRGDSGQQLVLPIRSPSIEGFQQQLDEAAKREQESRTRFAQGAIDPDEVQRELAELEPALGSARDVQRFIAEALPRLGGRLRETDEAGVYELSGGRLEDDLLARMPAPALQFPLRVRFSGPFPGDPAPALDDRAVALGRCHPLVELLADRVLGQSLAESEDAPFFSRSAAIRTRAVERRTAVFVLRLRYLLSEHRRPPTFAEEIVTAACRLEDGELRWIEPRESAVGLLAEAEPVENLSPAEREAHVRWGLDLLERHEGWQRAIVDERIAALQQAHERVRRQTEVAGALGVTPHEPPDILGCFVLIPVPGGA